MQAAGCNEFLCGYRLRFYPTLRQRRYLACAFGVAHFVWALGTKRDAYRFRSSARYRPDDRLSRASNPPQSGPNARPPHRIDLPQRRRPRSRSRRGEPRLAKRPGEMLFESYQPNVKLRFRPGCWREPSQCAAPHWGVRTFAPSTPARWDSRPATQPRSPSRAYRHRQCLQP